MRLSVLIPSFNSAAYLPATLATVARQQYEDLEVIVVDGGSKDDTSRVIQSHGDLITRFISEPDRGQLDAVQKALKHATGDLVFWLNADDVVMPGAFHYVSETFRRYPSTDIVFSDDYAFGEATRELWVGATIRGLTFADHFYFYRQMYSECVYWRRGITPDALPVDTSLRVATDYSFFLPLRHKRRCRWVPKRLGAFRTSPGQMSARFRDRVSAEQAIVKERMRQRLQMGRREFRIRRSLHAPSFLMRQVLYPKANSAIRYSYRRLTADRDRRNLAQFFFNEWIQPLHEPAASLV